MGSIKTRREIVVEKYLKEQVEKIGGKCLKMLPTYDAGVPDRLVLYKGQTVFIETKRQGLSPSKLQAIFMSQLNANGFETRVIDEKSQVDDLIRDLRVRSSMTITTPQLEKIAAEKQAVYDAPVWSIHEVEHKTDDSGLRFMIIKFHHNQHTGPVIVTRDEVVRTTHFNENWVSENIDKTVSARKIDNFLKDINL